MDDESRRPLKVRENKLSQQFARFLSKKSITPNQISVLSVVFALLAALSMLSFSHELFFTTQTPAAQQWWWLILAALFIQLRLLCNLFDGMVAVEGGKSTPYGELFNDIPDRLADPLLLVSTGYAVTLIDYASDLGWLAGLLAVFTAYIRTLSASIGAPVNFQGPMAKQHRMAVLTIACLITVIEIVINHTHYTLMIALLIIIFGSIITAIRRSYSAYHYLNTHNNDGIDATKPDGNIDV